MYPHSHEMLIRLVCDHVRRLRHEAQTLHLLASREPAPPLRRRLAHRLQGWALRLDPELLDAGLLEGGLLEGSKAQHA